MKIVCLMENTAISDDVIWEHGFSIYVETEKHKLLIDTGASSGFLENARICHVDLSQVDMCFLSHGHYDHSGGILEFSSVNGSAPVYMQKNAGDEYYHKNSTLEKYIGIDKRILELSQIVLLDGSVKLDDEISIFSGVKGRRRFPSGNLELMKKISHEETVEFIQDDFCHEQYVVISYGEKKLLVSGCAHNGILNILDEYEKLYGHMPDVVISGFHLMKKSGYTEDDIDNIKAIAEELKSVDTLFYTGHCTGVEPFDIMKDIMDHKLIYIHSGDIISL